MPGMLSVRPQLAGIGSGLGGAFTIGGGAALAALAGVLLSPGVAADAADPADAGLGRRSILCILWVMRRAHAQIGRLTLAVPGLQSLG